MSRVAKALAVVASLCLMVTTAGAAIAPDHVSVGAVPLPTESMLHPVSPLATDSMSKAPRWSLFEQEHGDWEVVWNGWTNTVHRAFGPSIDLGAPVLAKDEATDKALNFLRQQAPLTKAGQLDLRSAATLKGPNGVWYTNFLQYWEGYPVLLTDVTVRLHESGKVMMFGSDARSDIDLNPMPLLSAERARDRAKEGLQFDVNADVVTGGDAIFVLPLDHATGTDYHLVRRVYVDQKSPPHRWETYVDAHDGEVRWRHDLVKYGSAGGKITGQIKLHGPPDPLTTVNFEHMTVSIGPGSGTTDANGDYSIGGLSGTQTATFRLEGPWVDVNRLNGIDAQVTQSVATDSDPTNVDLEWLGANAHFSERMGFYHTNVVHDYIKAIDPGFTNQDYQIGCNVLDLSDECNAFWDGNMTFFGPGPTCNNIANLADVIYHEYGHAINHNAYQQAGSPVGLINGGFHEGMADIVACFLEDDPELGQNFFKATSTGIRNLDNTNTWPFDITGASHSDGQIIAGAMWDLREAVGEAVAAPLSHFAKYGLPDDGNYKIAAQELFIEVLVADDDNANLGDGTPHWNEILDAFNLHGIGPSLFLTFAHTPASDVSTPGTPVDISATVNSSSGLFSVDTSSVELVYSVNGGAEQTVAMPAQGGGVYTGQVPGQAAGSVVTYYVGAAAVGGGTLFRPDFPDAQRFVFLVGQQQQLVFDDLEAASGWTVGDVDDNAVTGIWVRATTAGVSSGGEDVQPFTDNTPNPGTQCFVTGNGDGGQLGVDDVDDGKTTLFTPIFDASGTNNPVVRYYRWYTNAAGGSPGADVWRVDISNDGGSNWTSVESTNASANEWWPIAFRVEDYLTPTATMQMRFIAEDIGGGSIVEAAVDDWELMEFMAATGLPELPGLPTEHALGQNIPNPFNPSTDIAFALPTTGPATLAIYDLAGRRVKTLVDSSMTAGRHVVTWNGTDDTGRSVSSGVYVYRLTAGSYTDSKRMVLVK